MKNPIRLAAKSAGTLALAWLLLPPGSAEAQVFVPRQPYQAYAPAVQPRYYAAPNGYGPRYYYPARPSARRHTAVPYDQRTVSQQNWPTGRPIPMYKPWLRPY